MNKFIIIKYFKIQEKNFKKDFKIGLLFNKNASIEIKEKISLLINIIQKNFSNFLIKVNRDKNVKQNEIDDFRMVFIDVFGRKNIAPHMFKEISPDH